jgi:DNA-binding XRE family transcriptional regulator
MTNDIRSLRREHALTLEEAATGILHPVSLCKIETGQCEPRAETIRKLAHRYHTTTADICRRWRVARAYWLAKQVQAVSPAPANTIELSTPNVQALA